MKMLYGTLTCLVALCAAASAQEGDTNQDAPRNRVILKKLHDLNDAAVQRTREYELVRSAVVRTDSERMLKFICCTKIAKAMLRDFVRAAEYFKYTAPARKDAHEAIQRAMDRLNKDLITRLQENGSLIDAILDNPKIREVMDRQDLLDAERARILREEFSRSPEAAQLITDLAGRIGELASMVDQLEDYREYIKTREAQWDEFAQRVEEERQRARELLGENVKYYEGELRTMIATERIGDIGVFGPPPRLQQLFNESPPPFDMKVPPIPEGGILRSYTPQSREINVEAVIKAIHKMRELRHRASATPKANVTSLKKKE